MNELAPELFKTFFQSKKSFLRKKLELVKVISKTEKFGDFSIPFSPKSENGVQNQPASLGTMLFNHPPKKTCSTFVHNCSICQKSFLDLIF